MKNPLLFAITLLLFVGISCKKADPQPTMPTNTAYTLTVNSGTGSGTYSANDTAFVFATPANNAQVFDKWTGNVAALTSLNEWRTTLKMPAANASVTATYKTATPFTFSSVVINGSQVYYYVPSNYKGIILPFHGAGGNASGWVGSNYENLDFCKYAAANGYALVITESKDRTNKKWDASGAASVDIANIDAILNTLQTNGIIAANKPKYGIGMSQGSGFCSLIAYVKQYKAGALYCLGGIDQVFGVSTVPII